MLAIEGFSRATITMQSADACVSAAVRQKK